MKRTIYGIEEGCKEEHKGVSSNNRYYHNCLKWVAMYRDYCSRKGLKLSHKSRMTYISEISSIFEGWKVVQADNALRFFIHSQVGDQTLQSTEKLSKSIGITMGRPDLSDWNKVENSFRKVLRLRMMPYQSEKTYMAWYRRFRTWLCHNGTIEPSSVSIQHIRLFIQHLMEEKGADITIRKQAFRTVMFLYINLLNGRTSDERIKIMREGGNNEYKGLERRTAERIAA